MSRWCGTRMSANDAEEGRGNEAPAPCRKPSLQAGTDWHLGGRFVGHRVLSTERIHGPVGQPQGASAPNLLVNS